MQTVNDDDKVMVITEKAAEVLANMGNRVRLVSHTFGEKSEEAAKVAASYAMVISTMFRLGGRITSEGEELSLYCYNDYIAYGVIWHDREFRDKEYPYNLLGEWSVHS